MNETIRKATLSETAGGISDTELRRYNSPNNNGTLDSNIVYRQFPELREAMEARTLTRAQYETALDRIGLARAEMQLHGQDSIEAERRYEMLTRRPDTVRDWVPEGTAWLPSHKSTSPMN